MFLFPNPYAHLDHKGRLAGVCPKGEPLYAPGKFPKRETIGASIDREHSEKTYDPGDEAQGISPSSDVRFTFATEAVAIEEHPALRMFYKHVLDAHDVFKVAKAEDVPLDELAVARAAAIAGWCANYGAPPDDANWKDQFSLDEQVKARAEELAKAAKAKAEAEAAKKKAEVDAKVAAEAKKKAEAATPSGPKES